MGHDLFPKLRAVLALAASTVFLAGNIWSDPRSSALSAFLLAASYPAYRWLARTREARGR